MTADDVEARYRALSPAERAIIINGITKELADVLLKIVPPELDDLIIRAGQAGPDMVQGYTPPAPPAAPQGLDQFAQMVGAGPASA